MDYGRLGKFDPFGFSSRGKSSEATEATKNSKLKLLFILAAVLVVASVATGISVVVIRNKSDSGGSGSVQNRRPSQAMSRTCSLTRYPTLCVNSLLDFPGAVTASEKDLVHITVNMTLQKFGRAFYFASDITNIVMDDDVRSAYEDCLELLDDSVHLLSRSLASSEPGGASASAQDVMTWLSAALTNHDTCAEGFEGLKGEVKDKLFHRLTDLSDHVSNCLAIYSAVGGDDGFYNIPIENRRRKLLALENPDHEQFPTWLSRRDRRLLSSPVTEMNADIVVSKDGNGTYKTIAEAIKHAPENSGRRYIIYVKAGRYEEEVLKVGRKKTNLMFIGDGKGKTVIAGGKNVQQKITTFRTATFAATGSGFIARDMSFENWAGPAKHQAVALRIGADHAVIYRCNIVGYQDTLYVHSLRQFYRECDIYGTVDFIFGNAAVVLQNCIIHARKPMPQQKVTITAQNRKDPNQNTGISIHACRLVAEPDLAADKGSYPTFLGRPWKLYSRVVYMLTYMGDHIHPRGWLEWNGAFALDSLYYGEYMNSGPGGAIGQRVKWPGYRVITATGEANKFTVGQFIYGSTWLPSTGVSYISGLST